MAWLRWVLTGLAAILAFLAGTAIALSFCLWINYSWDVPFGWWYLSFVVCALFGLLLALGLVLRRVVRRRWRFGTRTLLCAFTLVAVGVALLGNRIHSEWRRQLAVWQLTQNGGHPRFSRSIRSSDWLSNRLGYDPFLAIDYVEVRGDEALTVLVEHPDAFPGLTDIVFSGASDRAMRRAGELSVLAKLSGVSVLERAGRFSNAGLANLASCQALERLCLNGCTQITDAGLTCLENHPNLESLYVISEGKGKLPITDVGLASIGKLPQLRVLLLGESSVTDGGLRHLETLRELEVLRIQSVGITDAGLEHLARLPRLKRLSFFDASITDAGIARLSRIETLESLYIVGMHATEGALENLQQLANLKKLWIRNTELAPEVAKALAAALPDCEVKFDVVNAE